MLVLPPHPAIAAAATTTTEAMRSTLAPERRTATRRLVLTVRDALEIAIPIAGSAIVVCISVAPAVLRDATGGSRGRRRCCCRCCRCCHRGRDRGGCGCGCGRRCTRRGLGLRHLNWRRGRWWRRRRAHDKDPARFHRRILGERRHESIAAWSEVFQRVASGAGACPAAVECVPEGVRAAARGTGHSYVYGDRLAGLRAAVRRQDAEVWFGWWGALGRCNRGDRCRGGRGAG